MAYNSYKDYSDSSMGRYLFTLYLGTALMFLFYFAYVGEDFVPRFSDSNHASSEASHWSIARDAEDVVIAQGTITSFEPYFDGIRPNEGSNDDDGPLGSEGIEVVIVFDDQDGMERSIHETWMLPCVDHFKRGGTVPVNWSGNARRNAGSVVVTKRRLHQAITQSEAEDAILYSEQLDRISEMLDRYDELYRLIATYRIDFEDESTEWDFAEYYEAWKTRRAEGFEARRRDVGSVTSLRRKQRSGSQTLNVSSETDEFGSFDGVQ